MKTRVLSNQGDRNGIEQAILGEGEGPPLLPQLLALLDEGRRNGNLVKVQCSGEKLYEVLVVEEDGDVVGRVDIVDRNDLLVIDVAEERDFLDGGGVEGLGAAARDLFPQTVRNPASA